LLRKKFEEKNEHRGWFVAGGRSESDTPEGFVYGDFTTDMCWTCYFEANAALQSTIAQLQERVAELESGRGEPVCYQARHSENEPWFFTDKPGYWEWRPLFTVPPAPVAAVPHGWKLVPIEATKPMLRAFIAGGCSRSSYRDMIAAAPICLDANAALNGEPK
jgi:hypothetical protein